MEKMSHLILDSSAEVQKVAYLFLRNAAKRRTEYLVIEAGVDAEAIVKADLPSNILDILQRDVELELTDTEATVSVAPSGFIFLSLMVSQNVFGYLLGWMLLFDLFEDAVCSFHHILVCGSLHSLEP
jgi:hypothetical protein